MKLALPIPVLLTVPHLSRTSSPYRETMAIARYLPGEEFRLTLCALRENGFRETAPLLRDLGVDALVAPFRPTGRTPRHYLASYAGQRALDCRGPFALQHSMDYTSSPFEAMMARKKGRKFVYSQRNLNEGGHEATLAIKTRLATRIIGISGAVIDFLAARGVPARKISKIPLGLDLPEFDRRLSPCAARETGRILFVGHFERRKRHEDAIRALALLGGRHPEARLSFAGIPYDKAYSEELRRLAGSLGVAERVEFLGKRDDVPELIERSAAVMLCSESEAFGWVLLEAMAARVPVIAAATGGPAEVIDHGRTGLLVAPRDVAGYAAALGLLFEHPELAARLGREARRTVELHYSAAAMVDRIKQCYREALGILTLTHDHRSTS